jgi:hypothetical protein
MKLLKDFTMSRDLAGLASSRRSDSGFSSLVAGRQLHVILVKGLWESMGNKCRDILEIIYLEY